MEFGLFMMPLHPPNRSYADSYDRDLELLVLADSLGYHEAWIGEHVTETWENAPAPELIIAQALARTKNIILGTGVTLLPLHHPVDTAHRIAMLDHMARGRLYWGVGMRSIPTDLQMYGLDPENMDSVRERSREALEIVLGLWASEDGQYHYEGKHFSIHSPDAPEELNRRLYYKPYQKPHPPIGMAATSPSPSTPYMAGTRGWIPMSSPTLNAEKLRVHWDAYEEGARSSGNTPRRSDWRIARDVYVSDTPERARGRGPDSFGQTVERAPVEEPQTRRAVGVPQGRPGHARRKRGRGFHDGAQLDCRRPCGMRRQNHPPL